MSRGPGSRRAAWFVAACVAVIAAGVFLARHDAAPEPPADPASTVAFAAANPAIGTVSAPPPAGHDAAEVDIRARVAVPPPPPAATPYRTRIHVIDELGAPVPSVRVNIASALVPDAELLASPSSTLQNHDGHYTVFTDDAAPWRLYLQGRGFVATFVGPIADPDAPEIAVKLVRPALIHGITLAPDGNPIAGIGLVCRDLADPRRIVRTTSKEGGAFELTPDRPGLFAVCIDGAGENEHQVVRCDTGSPAELRLAVPAATTIEITLTLGGEPLAGASCYLRMRRGERSGTSDATGRLSWQCVPRGDHRLEIRGSLSGALRLSEVRDSANSPGFQSRTVAVDTRDPTLRTFAVEVVLEPTQR